MKKERKYPVGVFKSRRPRMTNHAGRTWDSFYLILPDGSRHPQGAYLDTTWGSYFYFQDELGQWWSGRLYDFNDGGTVTVDLRKRLT
jgi:hypothetical protein